MWVLRIDLVSFGRATGILHQGAFAPVPPHPCIPLFLRRLTGLGFAGLARLKLTRKPRDLPVSASQVVGFVFYHTELLLFFFKTL